MTAKARILGYLKLFRVVNLATVPGDLLVGAAVSAHIVPGSFHALLWAALASVFLYMFGLADNDIVGAKIDKGRPIPDGEISLAGARIARGLSLGAVMIVGALANLRPEWWIGALVLVVAVVVYNRTGNCIMMGLCRGLDVLLGVAAVAGTPRLGTIAAAAAWAAYFSFVTKYSEGEETDKGRKAAVGVLIGAVVYLQLAVLIVFPQRPLLIVGAVLLVVHRMVLKMLPEVSAS